MEIILENFQLSIREVKANVLTAKENTYPKGSEISKTALYSPETKDRFFQCPDANLDKYIHNYAIM